MKLLWQFLTNPKETGAVASSSKYLAKLICDNSNIKGSDCIVELGPGMGPFTREILERVGSDSRYFSLEINPSFYNHLRKKYPGLELYLDSARNLGSYLNDDENIDSVISGLPFASFGERLQKDVIDSVYGHLKDGGEFLTFAYLQGLLLPSGKRFKRLLNDKFREVKRTRVEWRNVPPAFVYRCVK